MPEIDYSNSREPSRDVLLAEFEFIHAGMRQDQRERIAYLGFALVASSTLLGLLVRDSKHLPSSSQAFVMIGIALGVTIVAEVLTIRATIGVASAGHYLREFIEPCVCELRFQRRNRQFVEQLRTKSRRRLSRLVMRSSVSGSWGLAIAYLVLTIGLVVAWFTADLSTHRDWWRDVILALSAGTSLALTRLLWWMGNQGAAHVGDAWSAVKAEAMSQGELLDRPVESES